jgi:hypothetical protein
MRGPPGIIGYPQSAGNPTTAPRRRFFAQGAPLIGLVDRHGPVWAAYGSEGWEFESLRARSLPATMFSLPESDTAAAKRLPALSSPQCAIR